MGHKKALFTPGCAITKSQDPSEATYRTISTYIHFNVILSEFKCIFMEIYTLKNFSKHQHKNFDFNLFYI